MGRGRRCTTTFDTCILTGPATWRSQRWFQMYKIHHWGREHWHPEFMEYEEKTLPYLPKAYRSKDYMKKKGLGRRYNKYLPKLTIPLEDEAAVYKLPKTKYEKDQF